LRRPLAQWTPLALEGPYKGIEPANVPAEILHLVARPDGSLDADMLHHLQTDFSYADMLDLLEMRNVHQSWSDAYRRNTVWRAERED
jgi:hypothetical protein